MKSGKPLTRKTPLRAGPMREGAIEFVPRNHDRDATTLRRVPMMKKRAKAKTRTKSNRDYLARVKALPCAVCGAPGPSAAHHIREGQGMAQRAADALTVPLCWECHQGTTGIHGDRSAWYMRKRTELGALADTIMKLVGT